MSNSLPPHGLQHARLPWTSLSPSLLKLMFIESVMQSNRLIFCWPLLLLPSTFLSFRIFSNNLAFHIRWPKYWSFSITLLQYQDSKASILRCSAFFMAQLSHPYMTTGQTTALTRWNFVCKVVSLFFNMLSRFAIVFLPRNKHLFISWLQSPSAVILEPKKIKFFTASTFSSSTCHEVMGPPWS